jgi:outer membrane lipoprotein-sorting protein
VKRISSTNKSGPFLGSEFAYEDLTAQELGKYDYQWLRDEPCPGADAGLQCYVVQRTPLYENSGYKRQIAWIDASEFLFRKIEFYNREDRLLKTLALTAYQRHDKFWRPNDLMMTNHQNRRSTRLHVNSIRFKTGLTESDFTEQSIERLR